MSCGVGHKCGSDLALLWLWHRPAAEAPIRPLAWEPPYDKAVALKKKNKNKKAKGGKKKRIRAMSTCYTHMLLLKDLKTILKNDLSQSSRHGSMVNESDYEP